MNYEQLHLDIMSEYENIQYRPVRRDAVDHTIRVISVISLFQSTEDIILLQTAALLHDLGKYRSNLPSGHAHRSAVLAEEILSEYGYSSNQIGKISTAIRNHSDKKHIHDEMSELLKDADVLARYIEDPLHYSHFRLKEALSRVGKA